MFELPRNWWLNQIHHIWLGIHHLTRSHSHFLFLTHLHLFDTVAVRKVCWTTAAAWIKSSEWNLSTHEACSGGNPWWWCAAAPLFVQILPLSRVTGQTQHSSQVLGGNGVEPLSMVTIHSRPPRVLSCHHPGYPLHTVHCEEQAVRLHNGELRLRQFHRAVCSILKCIFFGGGVQKTASTAVSWGWICKVHSVFEQPWCWSLDYWSNTLFKCVCVCVFPFSKLN